MQVAAKEADELCTAFLTRHARGCRKRGARQAHCETVVARRRETKSLRLTTQHRQWLPDDLAKRRRTMQERKLHEVDSRICHLLAFTNLHILSRGIKPTTL